MSPVRALMVAAAGFSLAVAGSAQYSISTHSGLVQLTMGSVYLKDEPVQKTVTNVLSMKDGDVLRTGQDGLAEVLLTPGVFLRLGHSASLRMDSNLLTDTRMTVLSGSAIVEADEILADNKLSFEVGNQPVSVAKKGLYRLEGSPASVAAIQGELFVGGTVNEAVKKGQDLRMDASAAEFAKLHVDKKEELYAFSQARSEDSAYATGVTASSFAQSGYSAANGCNSSWYFMGPVGMYSYLPCGGILSSPYGYGFYGLNSAYLWNGPGYYVPPFALLSGYGGGYVQTAGGGGVVANKGMGNGSMPTRVPVFSGPNGFSSMPTSAALNRSALKTLSSGSSVASVRGSSPRSVMTSAGTSQGHVAAVSSGRATSSGGGGGGFSGRSGSSSSAAAAPSASSMPARAGGGSSASSGHR